MARKKNRNTAVLQKPLPGMEPPPSDFAVSPEPVGTVAATCAGECRRSTQHTVERLQQPDGSVIVRRTCTVCDAFEQITISKVVAKRVLAVEQAKADPMIKDAHEPAPHPETESSNDAYDRLLPQIRDAEDSGDIEALSSLYDHWIRDISSKALTTARTRECQQTHDRVAKRILAHRAPEA